MVRISIHETNGPDASDHTLHVDVPATTTTQPLHGARGLAVKAEDWAHLTTLLKDVAINAALARPTIQSVKFEFNIPD
jgi:hypothetical protein